MSEVLRIGATDWIGYAPLYLAADLGYYSGSGVEIQFGLENKVRHDRFSANELDCIGTSLQAFCLEAPKVDARIVTALNQAVSPGSERIVSKATFRTLEDLQHGTICYVADGLEHFYFRYFFDQASLPFPAKTIAVESRPEMLGRLQTGIADAVVSYEPFITAITSDENFHVIPTGADLSVVIGVLVAHKRVLEEKSEQVQALITGYFRALSYLRDSQDEALAVLLPHFPDAEMSSLDNLRQKLDGVRYLSKAENLQLFGGPDARLQRAIDESVKVWREIGSLDAPLNARQLTDARFIRQIQEA